MQDFISSFNVTCYTPQDVSTPHQLFGKRPFLFFPPLPAFCRLLNIPERYASICGGLHTGDLCQVTVD
jgi:hypothetical protein